MDVQPLAATRFEVTTAAVTRRILREHGTPEVEGAETPEEAAIGLLQLAAEIEHALMVQYLYAANSIVGGSTKPAWRIIMSVAVQEMGHLISVQNLLLAIGGPESFHFGRDSIRTTSPDNPIPLVLESISKAVLAKFIVAEMPAVIPDPQLATRLEALKQLASQSAGVQPNRVGALYAKLFWLFQPDDTPIPPLNLTADDSVGLRAGFHLQRYQPIELIRSREALHPEWVRGSVSNFILKPVHDSASALSLITEISEQGEGLGDTPQSHFSAFLKMLDAFEAGQLGVKPLPTSPMARLAPAPDAGRITPIRTPYIKAWAELCDLRYNLLILDLKQAH